MSRRIPDQSPDDQKPPASLANRLATATTRLILIAIVAGGLLTAALNLRRPDLPDLDAPFNQSGMVAQSDDFLPEGLPVARVIVNGNEAAAREAVLRVGRIRMADAAARMVALQAGLKAVPKTQDPFADTAELASDPEGKWSIRQMQDLRRVILGYATAGPEPTVVFWGGYDETGPGEWTTWTMLLPLPEK